MSVTVVMLGHKSLAGKDTVAALVASQGWKRVAFADKLKETVADLYQFTHEQMHGLDKDVMDLRYINYLDPEKIVKFDTEHYFGEIPWRPYEELNPDYKPHLTPRRVLQIFGQDQRKLFPDIWASYVFNHTIQQGIDLGHSQFIVTDFRFKNEAKVAFDWANKTGNKVVCFKVHRPGVEAQTGARDISENDLNDFDHWSDTLVNDKRIDELQIKSLALFSKLL